MTVISRRTVRFSGLSVTAWFLFVAASFSCTGTAELYYYYYYTVIIMVELYCTRQACRVVCQGRGRGGFFPGVCMLLRVAGFGMDPDSFFLVHPGDGGHSTVQAGKG